jgi:hypothetical protein
MLPLGNGVLAMMPITTTTDGPVVTAEKTTVMTVATLGVMIAPFNRGAVGVVATLEGGAAVAMDVAGLLPGLMSRARYATRRGTMPKIVGIDTPTMMTMARRRSMLPMAWTQIGTRIQVLPITSRES